MARLYYLLNLAQHGVAKYANRICQEQLGITAAQLGALFILDKSPLLRQSELARTLSCTKGAVTSLSERLSAAGLIETVSCPKDRRANLLQLTQKGKDCVVKGTPLVRGLQRELTSGFSKSEVNTITRFLESAIEKSQ